MDFFGGNTHPLEKPIIMFYITVIIPNSGIINFKILKLNIARIFPLCL
jgi:hypothetical protein